MYSFYDSPPNTLQEVKDYLHTWLEPSTSNHTVGWEGSLWNQSHGFRRGFCIHSVYRNDIGKYVFDVQSDEIVWAGDMIPNMGVYDSWDAMIHGVAIKYCHLWHLPITV